MRRNVAVVVGVVVMVLSGALAAGAFGGFGEWGEAESIEDFGGGADDEFNTASLEGCPFISPDGKVFFIASNRVGGEGGLDIWMSARASTDEPWSEPVNLGPPINSSADDFCPTIARDGKTFFFVSSRSALCGSGPNPDIYTTRFGPGLEAASVTHLGCEVNSAFIEHSPFPAEVPGEGPVLFYSSTRPANGSDAAGDHDLYMSGMNGGDYVAGTALSSINTEFQDGQPNVRRDGQELFFYSNRHNPDNPADNDIYSVMRLSVTGDWGTPQNLGPDVNSGGSETRPSLSWDGTTLYFGTTRVGGQSDIFVTTR